jgi:hypothetical protein
MHHPDHEHLYPGNPSTTFLAKDYLPCWLKRLEEFIRLEKCPDTKRVQDAKGDKEEQDASGRR